jgi:formate hydrogenlyase subunit 3/multisubunit Na+/H+ antiporter MnhD subunit
MIPLLVVTLLAPLIALAIIPLLKKHQGSLIAITSTLINLIIVCGILAYSLLSNAMPQEESYAPFGLVLSVTPISMIFLLM